MNFSQRKTAFGERILIVRTDKFTTWTGMGWNVRCRDFLPARSSEAAEHRPHFVGSLERAGKRSNAQAPKLQFAKNRVPAPPVYSYEIPSAYNLSNGTPTVPICWGREAGGLGI